MSLTSSARKRIQKHIAALNSSDEKASARAEAYLIRYYGSRAVEPLLAVCDHPNPVVRFRAAWILGHTHDPRAYEALCHLTCDPDEAVRYDAAIALGISGDARAIELLILLMSTPDPEASVDSAAAMGLQRLGKPAVPALLSLLQNAESSLLCNTAWILGSIGDEAAIEPLAELLTHEEEKIRIVGIEALAEIGTPRCLAHIQERLEDTSEEVRNNAAYWCQELHDKLSGQMH